MNKIQETMKQRIMPLLLLIKKANLKVEDAEKQGYKVVLNSGGDGIGRYDGDTFVVVNEFSKNLINNKKACLTSKPLECALEKVTKELVTLEKEGYMVDVSCRRPNDTVMVVVEDVSMIVLGHELAPLY